MTTEKEPDMRSSETTVIEDQANTLAHDFEDVVTGAQDLIASLGAEGGAKLAQARTSADQYVRDNPWSAACIGAGIGLLAGYFLARRAS